MPEFFGYNQDRGTWYEAEFEDDVAGTVHIRTMHDSKPLLEHIARKRNSGNIDKGIKKGFWRYCSIPPWLEVELRNKGINIYSKDPKDTNKLLRIIDEEYPKLKYTTKKHRVSG
jgi:hypothetical protein